MYVVRILTAFLQPKVSKPKLKRIFQQKINLYVKETQKEVVL